MSLEADNPQAGNRPLGARFRAEFLFGAIVLLEFCAAAWIGQTFGMPFHPGTASTLVLLFTVLLPWFVVILAVWHLGYLAIRIRPDRPIARFVADTKSVILDPHRMLRGTALLLGTTLFVGAFSYLKTQIPRLNSFVWDQTFADIDRVLHFGRAPYEWLNLVFGTPLATTALNAAYHLWFFLVYLVVFLACFTAPNRKDGIVFLISLALTFAIGGNLIATLLSSAGPVYFERLGYGTEFSTLMSQLREFDTILPVWALNVQDILWQGYSADGPISGISAMPSMHVASSVLLALYGFSRSRWAGWCLGLFAFAIMIGSVHLAWHYAIDGYLGALIAVGFWKFAQRLVR